MRALLFDGSLKLRRDHPGPLRRTGICNTDLEIAGGYMGYSGVLGHEFVGVVEQSDDERLLDRRVVGEINLGCGECELCRAGMRNLTLRKHGGSARCPP